MQRVLTRSLPAAAASLILRIASRRVTFEWLPWKSKNNDNDLGHFFLNHHSRKLIMIYLFYMEFQMFFCIELLDCLEKYPYWPEDPTWTPHFLSILVPQLGGILQRIDMREVNYYANQEIRSK